MHVRLSVSMAREIYHELMSEIKMRIVPVSPNAYVTEIFSYWIITRHINSNTQIKGVSQNERGTILIRNQTPRYGSLKLRKA